MYGWKKTSPLYIDPDGLFVWSQFSNNVPGDTVAIHVQTHLINYQSNAASLTVRCQILGPDGVPVGSFESRTNMVDYSKKDVALSTVIGMSRGRKVTLTSNYDFSTAGQQRPVFAALGPMLWSPESPSLYKLITTVESNGKVMDRVETNSASGRLPSMPKKDFC